jgi:hypothetical protein
VARSSESCLADGTYTTGLDVHNQPVGAHLVTIQGNSFTGTSCPGRDNVVIAPTSGVSFVVQDIAILGINCMKIAGGSSVNGIYGRQFAIIDADWINFGDVSVAVSGTDHVTINLGGDIAISGNMVAFGFAANQSMLRTTCPVTITNPVTIAYFFLSYSKSYITLDGGASFINPGNVTGQQYLVYQDGDINTGGRTVPGTVAGSNVDGTGHVY